MDIREENVMNHNLIKNGFLASGIINVGGMLLFSKGLSNELLMATDPVLFSLPGCLSIILWGLAYIACRNAVFTAPYIALVFALEKLLYVVIWGIWLSQFGHTLPHLFEQDLLTGLFYAIYGANDALFMLLFIYAFVKIKGQQRQAKQMT